MTRLGLSLAAVAAVAIAATLGVAVASDHSASRAAVLRHSVAFLDEALRR